MKRPLLAALVAAALLCAGACADDAGSDAAPTSGVDSVRVEDNRFAPQAIEVPVGTTVTWRFVCGSLHDVRGDGFASERLASGTYSHTFDAPGDYPYRCTLHGGMTGRVVVTD